MASVIQQTRYSLESQLKVLEKLFMKQPEKIEGKWNSKHFKFKNKIAKLNKELNKIANFEFLAR